ncbi:helix-turn-helix domain-containing protein [Thomasclavelia cocleata]|jgi:transcriptional regulator with XRE-family HTH domain|uniref:helix-turn-helix domain-containing protein n=1 Tax=Thomasclavelia cocleata TaxID=69824 RepID=UPI00241C28B6|nr:helix-turn-helix transcriptional regulator [Thomasclavelia cocleata]
MIDNQLGRNIQHLRIIHNETLDELGCVIHCAKSTVKGYENGSRKPDLQILQLLSVHYNKSVDELLYTDLTGLENISIDLNSSTNTTELLRKILPLHCSEEAMRNQNFKNGYDLSQRLLEAFSNAEVLSGSIIVRIFEAFAKATDESESPEAVANLVWSVFIWWFQIYDTNKLLSLQDKLLSKKLTTKDFMMLKDTEDISITQKKISFISDFDEIITEAIKALKSDQDWSDLADYYLALRYMVGMVDTDLSTEMNSAVGLQMMLSFMALGNSHAFTFCKTCLSEN